MVYFGDRHMQANIFREAKRVFSSNHKPFKALLRTLYLQYIGSDIAILLADKIMCSELSTPPSFDHHISMGNPSRFLRSHSRPSSVVRNEMLKLHLQEKSSSASGSQEASTDFVGGGSTCGVVSYGWMRKKGWLTSPCSDGSR